MAKRSQVLRDEKRKRLIEKYAERRAALRKHLNDPAVSIEEKLDVSEVDSSERIWISSATDTTWEQVGTAHGTPHAITVTDTGALLIVDDSGVTLLPSPSS